MKVNQVIEPEIVQFVSTGFYRAYQNTGNGDWILEYQLVGDNFKNATAAITMAAWARTIEPRIQK